MTSSQTQTVEVWTNNGTETYTGVVEGDTEWGETNTVTLVYADEAEDDETVTGPGVCIKRFVPEPTTEQ